MSLRSQTLVARAARPIILLSQGVERKLQVDSKRSQSRRLGPVSATLDRNRAQSISVDLNTAAGREPIAFLGGILAGFLGLSLDQDPLKEWIHQTAADSQRMDPRSREWKVADSQDEQRRSSSRDIQPYDSQDESRTSSSRDIRPSASQDEQRNSSSRDIRSFDNRDGQRNSSSRDLRPYDSQDKQRNSSSRDIRPYIGIKMVELNQQIAAQMRQKDSRFPEVMQGILVTNVAANSPAAQCDLREGDVITGFAGQSDDLSTNHWAQCLSQHVNKYMHVKVIRVDAGTLNLKIKATEASQ